MKELPALKDCVDFAPDAMRHTWQNICGDMNICGGSWQNN